MSNLADLQAVLIADDVNDVLDLLALKINRAEFPVSISADNLFCIKTGKPIAKREISAVYSAVKIIGKNDAIVALYNSHGLAVHPAWLFSDPEHLDVLQESDPLGYVVYCLGFMTNRFYQTKTRGKMPQWASRDHNPDRHYAIARSHALLADMPVNHLAELASVCCRCLCYAPDALGYIERQIGKIANAPDTLAFMARNGNLIHILNRAIDAALSSLTNALPAIARAKFEDVPRTPMEAAKGPTQIRKQSLASRRMKADEIEHLAYMIEATKGLLGEKEKIDYFTGETLNPYDLNIEKFMNLDFEEIGEDADDNEVEIRRLAIPRPLPEKPIARSWADRLAHKSAQNTPAPTQSTQKPTTEISARSALFRFAKKSGE